MIGTDINAWLMQPFHSPVMVLGLGLLRVMAAVTLLLAARVSQERGKQLGWLLTIAFYVLAACQVSAALAMELPDTPPPSRWIILGNLANLGIGLGYYLRYIRHHRRN